MSTPRPDGDATTDLFSVGAVAYVDESGVLRVPLPESIRVLGVEAAVCPSGASVEAAATKQAARVVTGRVWASLPRSNDDFVFSDMPVSYDEPVVVSGGPPLGDFCSLAGDELWIGATGAPVTLLGYRLLLAPADPAMVEIAALRAAEALRRTSFERAAEAKICAARVQARTIESKQVLWDRGDAGPGHFGRRVVVGSFRGALYGFDPVPEQNGVGAVSFLPIVLTCNAAIVQ